MIIHIATVHWKSDTWFKIQLQYFKKHIQSPYKVYTYMTGIKNYNRFDNYQEVVFCKDTQIASHADKLDKLANTICQKAPDNDIIIFIDGDAIPIKPLDDYISEKLENSSINSFHNDSFMPLNFIKLELNKIADELSDHQLVDEK